MFAVFLGDKGAAAMRATEFRQQKTALIRREPGITDFAQELPFGAIVLIKEWLGDDRQRGQEQSSGMWQSERRLMGRIILP